MRRAALLLLVAGLSLPLSGCGSKPARTVESTGSSTAAPKEKLRNPKEVPLPSPPTGVVNIYSNEPGFSVFVDGELARDEQLQPLLTPCAVTVIRGRHRFVMAKEGFKDVDRDMSVGQEENIIATAAVADEGDDANSMLEAPLLESSVGEPLPLASLNTPGVELDPFLEADGRTIWFVSMRPGGKGIYFATRPSPYHGFGEPTFVPVTRSPDALSSPSITANGLLLVYASADKARLSAIHRPAVDADFTNPESIQFAAAGGFWPSAQISADGRQVFWTQAPEEGKPLQTMRASRRALDQKFSGTTSARLPGGHPCFSVDGLRQYVFDGSTLRRARRTTTDQPFSDLEVVTTLKLEGYVATPNRRQFAVSDDEQWLIYSNNPEDGDLFMVRLANGPGWGLAPRGKSIAPLPQVARKPDEPETPEPKPEETAPPIDPRALPLPYAAFREGFRSLMAERRYDEAEKSAREALKDDKLAADRDLIRWDLAEVEEIKRFWDDVNEAVAKLKPGSTVRVAGAKVDFVNFEEGVLHLKARAKELEKQLDSMAAGDLADLVEDSLGKTNEDAQRRIGTFLLNDAQGSEKGAENRLKRGGKTGAEVLEHVPARMVHLADQEIRRDKAAAGLMLLEAVLDKYEDSAAAEKAKALNEEVYTLANWVQIGPRQWAVENGMYTADGKKSAGAALQSRREYDNFELRTEYRVSGSLGQGGVYFHWNGRQSPNPNNAFKIHLANDAGTAPDKFSTGSLFKVEAPTANASLPEGKWNTLVLRVVGESVVLTINGKRILDTKATSKTIGGKGLVCLDGEVGGISYRRTLLLDLPGPKGKAAPMQPDDE
ncbi:MAG: DUF1080 domain-containing protein [Planctomycetaceae bacterium]|nr:DUF1080 domain-containing protein [Planctomycetaceae bacterium]